MASSIRNRKKYVPCPTRSFLKPNLAMIRQLRGNDFSAIMAHKIQTYHAVSSDGNNISNCYKNK